MSGVLPLGFKTRQREQEKEKPVSFMLSHVLHCTPHTFGCVWQYRPAKAKAYGTFILTGNPSYSQEETKEKQKNVGYCVAGMKTRPTLLQIKSKKQESFNRVTMTMMMMLILKLRTK